MEKISRCDLCEYRNNDKLIKPCSRCIDNKTFISHFKLAKGVETVLKGMNINISDVLEKEASLDDDV